MEKKKRIYSILKDGEFHTSLEIGSKLNLSDKTIREQIKELRSILSKEDIVIETVRGKGYRISNLVKDIEIPEKINTIPTNSKERMDYILFKLIDNDYIKIEDIAYEIYASTRTISQDIKNLKCELCKFSINILSKPHYGLTLQGQETDIRNFLMKYRNEKLNQNLFEEYFSTKFTDISKDTLKFIYDNKMQFSDVAFFNLVLAIHISFKRIERKKYVEDIVEAEKEDKFNLIKEFIIKLKNKYYKNVKLTDNELNYIAMHFLSRETLNLSSKKSYEIDELICELIKYIEITYGFKIKNKEELYTNLYRHLIPLTIRTRFNIELSNPLLDEIKTNMPIAYNIAIYISEIINNKMKCKISDDEVGYLAVIIEMALDIKDKINSKKNILIVCPSGRGTSKFLQYSYNKLFKDYINFIQTCGIKELDFLDLDNFDLIFSVVDIEKDYGKKINKVNWYLKPEDIELVRKLLVSSNNEEEIMSKDLFISLDEENLTKDKVIKILCDKMIEFTKTKFNLYEEVIKREELGYTELFNSIAIPHPLERGFGFDKVAIAVLKKPIIWDQNEVSIVLLICLDNMNEALDKLYLQIYELFSSKELVEKIIKNPTYENFVQVLNGGGVKI